MGYGVQFSIIGEMWCCMLMERINWTENDKCGSVDTHKGKEKFD